jgi:hypothetical protein
VTSTVAPNIEPRPATDPRPPLVDAVAGELHTWGMDRDGLADFLRRRRVKAYAPVA